MAQAIKSLVAKGDDLSQRSRIHMVAIKKKFLQIVLYLHMYAHTHTHTYTHTN